MRAEIAVCGRKLAQSPISFRPSFMVGVIRLVRAEESPDRLQFPDRLLRIDFNGHFKRRGIGGTCRRQMGTEHCNNPQEGALGHHDVFQSAVAASAKQESAPTPYVACVAGIL